LSYWLIISLQDLSGHLIEYFVNDWYLTTNMLEVSKLGR